MKRRQLSYTLVTLVVITLLIPAFSAAALADTGAAARSPATLNANPLQPSDDPETLLEQATALAAEQNPGAAGSVTSFPQGPSTQYPLFVGVDDTTVPAYQIDVTTNASIQAFVGAQVWGSAYDAVNDKVYFNSGSTLYEWPVGGAIAALGTITDPGGATQSMVGLAFYNGTLYGVKNIANEAVYTIDTNTRVATVFIDYLDADYDFGGLAADPNTGVLYATNDDTTPFGSGLFRINGDGTATQITPYPVGETDIDGLAVSHDGFAYLVTDQAGNIYVWNFTGGAYATPLTNPWTSSEVFSAGAWIWQQEAAITLNKTVGTDPNTCALTDEITVASGTEVTYCYTVENTGTVELNLHDLDDSELGSILNGFPFALSPTASAFMTISTIINVTTVNTGTWSAYNAGPVNLVTATDVATVTVQSPTAATLADLAAGVDRMPAPLDLPLAALPAAAAAVLGAAFIWRRKRK